ncbi:hypothetical protein SS1G_08078 [Sclerotinia sclerotiorum 1980 UF-70]|uniref:Trafficking protein particle complex subunit n=1 Tax=Sclerotinia sclerotiorum (strain ATCC 18683 / 1980 / Ss-1) TaxID=665079 RepID=A7ERX3_SCLS1|nr:hypothetical protein SS1G_08078 [Sclerotinia sclerotiorum 1980 UF-70]EDN92215.1 hypothetical protein SS1G_08078 [Sclerotinia sclerotiorum 1980 UF-70]
MCWSAKSRNPGKAAYLTVLGRGYRLPGRVVFALTIINKAGGLIYQKDFADGLNKLSINDYLVLAGTFHGVHAISTRLNPIPTTHLPPGSSHLPTTSHSKTLSTLSSLSSTPASDDRPDPPSGIEVLETTLFRLQCFQTLTGTKFLLFTEPGMPNVESILRKIYELYTDYVMKNPFYQLEMPIRCERFERGVERWVRGVNMR